MIAYGNGTSTGQAGATFTYETWRPAPEPFDIVYDVDDGHDVMMIGFEYDADNFALHRVQREPLLKWAREFVARYKARGEGA